ncbi:MAG: DUF6455 family protein [Pseudomonadota bacterium]
MLTQTFRSVCDWFVRRQDQKALGGFSGAELTAGALSKSALLEALDAPTDTRAMMSRMAEKKGVRPEVLDDVNGRVWLMAGACSRCRKRDLCGDWLDGRAKKSDPDWFCPNASHFDELKN